MDTDFHTEQTLLVISQIVNQLLDYTVTVFYNNYHFITLRLHIPQKYIFFFIQERFMKLIYGINTIIKSDSL